MNLPNLPYVKIAKQVTSLIVGAGTSQIVKGIIQNNTNPESAVDKTTLYAATFVVSAMVAKATKKYTDPKIDSVAVWWTDNVTKKFDTEETPELEPQDPSAETE